MGTLSDARLAFWGSTDAELASLEAFKASGKLAKDLAFKRDVTVPALEGLPVLMYGNSFIGQDTMNTVGGRWPDRVKIRTGLGTLTNRHEGGSSLWDIAKKAIGTIGAVPIVAGTKGIVMIGGATLGEQLVVCDGSNALQRAYVKNTMRAILAAASAVVRSESSSFTATGAGWITSTQTILSGGSYRYSPTLGDYLEYTTGALGTSYSTTHDLFLPSLAQGFGRAGMDVFVNGVLKLENVGSIVDPTPEPSMNVIGFDLYTLTGVNPGDVVRLTVKAPKFAGTNPSAGVDMLSIRSLAPPLVVVTKDPNIGLGNALNIEEFRQAIQEACDEFPNAICIDMAPGFSRATMIGSDNIHLNDVGQDFYATTVMDTLSKLGFLNGQNLVSLATT